jgi:RimJ/RimL family protein N-acetyltransferase
LRTERTLMRRWRESDLAPFAALNADPAVMEHFPEALTAEQTATAIEWIEAGFEDRGYGLWAVELPGESSLIGFVGLQPAPAEMPFAPAVEIGWRLAAEFWGRGLASEAARAAMAFAFGQARLEQLVSFTASTNTRSMRVMERLGMHRDPTEDFDNPRVAIGHPLRPHVLYRIDRAGWELQFG